jgi:alpha-beta hydrolase superfamily lysophospholipase
MSENDTTTTGTSKTTISIRGMDCHVHHWNVDLASATVPKALVVIFHGFLAHGNYPTVRYAAEFLAEAGYAVVAVDFPGHGKSEGSRGYLESADTVIQDGATIVDYARGLYKNNDIDKNASPKIMLVGSSMGGAIALSVAQSLEGKDIIAGVVLLAPMLKLNVSSIEHGALQCLAYVLPTVPLIPSSATDSAKQYRDDAKRTECDADTLTVSGAKLRVASALACVDITLNLRKQFDQITCPFFLMIAEEDVVVKNEGSEELYIKSPSTDKMKKNYPALHGLLCEPSPLFDEIKSDMLNWMNERA